MRIFLSLSAILVSVLFADGATKEGVVRVSALKMRMTPSSTGTVVTILPKGTRVRILEETPEKIKIDGIESNWLKVDTMEKTGWVFGDYVATPFQFIEKTDFLTWSVADSSGKKPYEKSRDIVLYNVQTKKEFKVSVHAETGNYAFSDNLKFIAVDAGTDVVGGLYILNMQNGKTLHNFSYQPRTFEWQGNQLKFNHVLCSDDGFTLYEEIVFNDGKLSRTGKFGKGDFHAGREFAGDCKKHSGILKKVR